MADPQRARGWNIVWRILRPFLIFAENYIMPPDPNDSTPVEFVVERGSSVSTIARELKEADLVRNKGVFQYLSEFIGKGHQLKAGTYTLSRDMTIPEIIDVLSAGDGGTDVMNFTIVEGLTVEEIGQSLVDQGVFESADRFLEICRTGEGRTWSTPTTRAAPMSWRDTSIPIRMRSTSAPRRRRSSAACWTA